MTKLLQRVEVTLRSFYIFNSSFSQREGEEHKKILYYHPNDIELNTKIKDVGLSEAIITFTGTFTANEGDCKALHTQKTTQLFYQPEPGYWMVLVLNVPKETKLRDGIEVTEYRGSDISDRIYSAVLRQCYHMFRLFGGTFQANVKASATDKDVSTHSLDDETRLQFCENLQLFYDKYLLSLKLSHCDIMDMMKSIQYLALDKTLFLRAHNFIQSFVNSFSAIDETILLYNEQVVCSGKLCAEDLCSLHEYIVGNVLDKARHSELTGAVLTRSNSATGDLYQNGAFITGPEQELEQQTTVEEEPNISSKPPLVYLCLDEEKQDNRTAYKLVIYRALNATLCLFVKAKEQLKNDYFNELHTYMGPQLTSLARDIGEQLARQPPTGSIGGIPDAGDSHISSTPKYLFINQQSLKHHTNIFVDRSRRRGGQIAAVQSVPRNVINLIADLSQPSLETSQSTAEECQVKTTNDYWIVRRRCNWRQYYVILLNSKATLLDVTQEAKRIFEQELTDDVFFDK